MGVGAKSHSSSCEELAYRVENIHGYYVISTVHGKYSKDRTNITINIKLSPKSCTLIGSTWYLRRVSPYKNYAYRKQGNIYKVLPTKSKFNLYDRTTNKVIYKVLLDDLSTQNIQIIIPADKLETLTLKDGRKGKGFSFFFDKQVNVIVREKLLGAYRLGTKYGSFFIFETPKDLKFYKRYSHKLLNTYR